MLFLTSTLTQLMQVINTTVETTINVHLYNNSTSWSVGLLYILLINYIRFVFFKNTLISCWTMLSNGRQVSMYFCWWALWQLGGFLRVLRFLPSSGKTDLHDLTEILLKVALNTITLTLNMLVSKKEMSLNVLIISVIFPF